MIVEIIFFSFATRRGKPKKEKDVFSSNEINISAFFMVKKKEKASCITS